MTEVLLSADLMDGNDPIEARADFPEVPRKGDTISCWDPAGSTIGGATEVYLTVDLVVWSTFEDGRIVVCVSLDGYDAEALEHVMRGITAGVAP